VPRDRDDDREQQPEQREPLAFSGDGRPTLPSAVAPSLTGGGMAVVWLSEPEPGRDA
jgi:hypothetical protein